MSLADIRISWRLHLSDAAHDVDATAHLITLRYAEESAQHLYARLIAWALWYRPELRFAAADDPSGAALIEKDLTGREVAWVMLDPPSAEELAHAARHHRGALVAAAFSSRGAWDSFAERSRSWKGLERVEMARIDEGFLDSLAEGLEERRYDVDLTLVEDAIYLSAGGRSFEGHAERFTGIPAAHGARPPARG